MFTGDTLKEKMPQAVILAGGLGTRLRTVTKNRMPKSMVPVNGRPFLYHLLIHLRENGITDILLLVGHLSHQIEEYFGSGEWLGMDINYSVESEPMGTGGAVRLAIPKIKGDFILMYGDDYAPYPIAEIYTAFLKSGKTGMITVYTGNELDAPPNVRIEDQEGGLIVKDYCKKEVHEGMNGVEAGVSVFKKSVLSMLDREKFSFEEYIFPRLIRDNELAAFPTDVKFYDIGTPERLKIIGEMLNDNNQ